MSNDVAYENTDKEIWREIPNDYYSPSIFVTQDNKIGINVGGYVYVRSAEHWHSLIHESDEGIKNERCI